MDCASNVVEGLRRWTWASAAIAESMPTMAQRKTMTFIVEVGAEEEEVASDRRDFSNGGNERA